MSTSTHALSDSLMVASFRLGGATFGIDGQQIQEVAKVGEITPVHHAPADVVGVRNLRGRIVTVIDLAARLELGSVVPSPANRVLIVEWQGEPIGLVVDEVGETLTVRPEDCVPPPPNLPGVQSQVIRGVFRSEAQLVAVLDHVAMLQPECGNREHPEGSAATGQPQQADRTG